MSVPIISSTWQKFNNLKTEDFTSKIMLAVSMTELVKDFDEKDKKYLIWLRDNTHKEIKTPIYELDRYVDETKGKISNNFYTINDKRLSQNKIQYYLCLAMEEINKIIFRNFKDYKTEEKAYIDEDEELESWV